MQSIECAIETLRLTRSRSETFTALLCIFENQHSADMALRRAQAVEHKNVSLYVDIFPQGFMLQLSGGDVEPVFEDMKKAASITRVPYIVRQLGWIDLPPATPPVDHFPARAAAALVQ